MLGMMRITIGLFFISVFLCQEAYSQDAKISIQRNDVPIEKILEQIEKQTKYLFIYNNEIDMRRRVTVNIRNKPLSQVLDDLFSDKGICYSVTEKHIILSGKCKALQQTQEGTVTLSGQVVFSSDKAPAPGVSIYVKETSFGTITDVDGRYVLVVPASVKEVTFSFMGYQEKQIKIENTKLFRQVSLDEGNQTLDEVIVTGLGSQRKVSVVGAVSTIAAGDLQVPATSISNVLGGKIPGVITMQLSGEPGKNISEFWIRGISTFGANSSALVLIDGLEGDLNTIDPADIESFSILKDASATAVYGVRGANGVVLVTTKKGRAEKLTVNFRSNFTISLLKKMPDYLHAFEYAQLANEARVVRDDEPVYTTEEMEIIRYGLDKDLYPDVDWQKEIVKPYGYQHTHYVSARGGKDIARYFISLGVSNESAAYRQDRNSLYKENLGFNAWSFRTNLDIALTKGTSVFWGVSGYQSRQSQPGIASTDYLWEAQSQLTPLLIPKVYSTGHLPAWGPGSNYSPYVMLNYTGTSSNQSGTAQTTLALSRDLSFIGQGLKMRVQGAVTRKTWLSERRYVLPEMYYASSRGADGSLQLIKKLDKVAATYSYDQRQYARYHFESTLNYDRSIRNDHRLSSLIYYFMSQSKDTYDIDNSRIDRSIAAVPKRYQGISGRFTYGYRDTYLLDANFGYTGSENFQKGRRFGFFPSIAFGWVPGNYGFIKKSFPWINFLKIRGSYGSVGNDQLTSTRFPYRTIVNENAEAGWGFTGGGITEISIGVDNLKWEKAIKSNIGIEGRFFNDKVSLVIDFFRDQRDGIFQRRTQIPDYVGLVSLPYGNVGKMKSWGSDGNLAYTHSLGKNKSISFRGNFTYSRNEIQNWEQASLKYDYQEYSGFPYHVIRGYIARGLFRNEQDVKSSPEQNFGSKVLPGDIKYKDVNGDGRINTDDQVVLSYPTYPRLMYGFVSELRYKNLTIGIMFKGTGNTNFFHVGYDAGDGGGPNGIGYVPFHEQETGNVLKIVAGQKNRWTPASYSNNPSTENPNARFPRLTYGYNANNSQLSTFWKDNCKYIRLQEITVNYNWTPASLKKIGLNSVDLQLVGTNLYVWDQLDVGDPEQAYQNGRVYPIPARFTFQVYLNF